MSTAEFTVLDWVIVGGSALLTVVGFFLGFSGQLGTIAGFAAASAAGYLLSGPAQTCATLMGFGDGSSPMPGYVVNGVFALLAFGLARILVKRFVRSCLGPFANCLLGALVGLVFSAVLTGLLAGIGTAGRGQHLAVPFAQQSQIVHTVAAWADGVSP